MPPKSFVPARAASNRTLWSAFSNTRSLAWLKRAMILEAEGKKEAMIREAQQRIAGNPKKYIHHIYGLDEAGGTCVLHISSVRFEELGYILRVPRSPMVAHTEPAMKTIPMVMLGLATVLGASYALRTRKQRNSQQAGGAGSQS